MIGHVDVQLPLPDKFTPLWHKSPSLSSATTTDEDFLAGSPKQRWADLSEEDDDMFTSERSPFGCLQDEVKVAPNSAVECADETIMPHVGNEAHSNRMDMTHDSSAKFYDHEQFTLAGSAHADAGPYYDRKDSRQVGCLRGSAFPFTMLPPTFESRSLAGQAVMVAPQAQRDVPAQAETKDAFTVTLNGVPPKLCTDACLDAILWASGVQKSTLGYHAKKTGYVVINFCTSEAAAHCFNHFKSCSWATGKLQVDLVLPNSSHMQSGNGHAKGDSQNIPSNRRLGKHTRSSFAQPMW